MSCKGEKKRRGYHIMVSDRDFPYCETCQADSGYAAGAEVGRAVKALDFLLCFTHRKSAREVHRVFISGFATL